MLYKDVMQLILDECHTALSLVQDKDIDNFIDMILSSNNVFFIGVGRVKLSLEAFAKRLFHLGINVHIVGDINEPALNDKDLLIVGSGSGESIVPLEIARKAKKIGAKIVHIGSNKESSLKSITDLMIRIPVQTKLYLNDEISSKQPMSSLFEQSLLLFGDIVSFMMIDRKKMDLKKLWEYHANLE